jgi:hypothetical protein
MFVEDLSGYDVHIVPQEGYVLIGRMPEEGWKPDYQDHLRDLDTVLDQDLPE